MAFTALVDAIVKNIRDPDNHCNSSLIHTLKKEIVNDLTNAYVQSEPLVNKYAALYVESKSFLDFMLRFCDLKPPKPLHVNSSLLQCKIDELEKSLKEYREQQSPNNSHSDDPSLESLQLSLDKSQLEIDLLTKNLKECNEKKEELIKNIEDNRFYSNLYEAEKKTLNKTRLQKIQELEECQRDKDKCLDEVKKLKEEILELKEQLQQCRKQIKEVKCSDCGSTPDYLWDDKDIQVDNFNQAIEEPSDIYSASSYLKSIMETARGAEEQCKAFLKELNESNKKEFQVICQQHETDRQAFEMKLTESANLFNFEELSNRLMDVFKRTLQISEICNAIDYIKQMKDTFTAPQILTYDPDDLNKILENAKMILGNIQTRQAALEVSPTPLTIQFPQEQMQQLQSYIDDFNTSLQSHLDTFKRDVLVNQPMYNISELNTALMNATTVVERINAVQQPSGLFSHPAIEGSPTLPMLIPSEQLQAITDSVSQVETKFKHHIEEFQKQALAKITHYDPTALNDVLKNVSQVLNKINATQDDINRSHAKLAALIPPAEQLAIEYPKQLESFKLSISNFEEAVKTRLDEYNKNAGALIQQYIPNEAINIIKELKIEQHFEKAINSMRALPWHDRQDEMTEFFNAAQKFVTMMPSIEGTHSNSAQGRAITYVDVPMTDGENKDTLSISSTSYQENVSGYVEALKAERDNLEKENVNLKSNACSCQILRNHFVSIYNAKDESWVNFVIDNFRLKIEEISKIKENIEKLNNLIQEFFPRIARVDEMHLPEQMEYIFNQFKSKYRVVDVTFDNEIEELKRYVGQPAIPNDKFIMYLKNLIDEVRSTTERQKKMWSLDNDNTNLQKNLRNEIEKKIELEQQLKQIIESKNQLEQDLEKYQINDSKSEMKIARNYSKSEMKPLIQLYRIYQLDTTNERHSVEDFREQLYKSKLQSFEDLERQCISITKRLNITLEPVTGLKWKSFEEKLLEKVLKRKKLLDNYDDDIREEGPKRFRVVKYETKAQRDGTLINDLVNLLIALYVQYFRLLWDSKYRKIEPMPQNLQDDLRNKLITLARLTDDEEKSNSYYFEFLKNYVYNDLRLYNGENPYEFQFQDTDELMISLLRSAMNETEKNFNEMNDKWMLRDNSNVDMLEQPDMTIK